MKTLTNKVTLINVISSLLFQILTIINGFIIPRLILSYFGSDVNGLTTSISQFLTYISLIEGGITGIIMASLYKPLYEKDYSKISSIVNTANSFYRKIGSIFILYSIIIAILYPLIFDINFSFIYVFLLTIILSISLFVQYMFSLTAKTLLNADKKVYIVSLTQSIILIINIILAFISVKIYPSIHMLKFISGILFIFQPIIFNSYIKKHYDLNKKSPKDKNLLKSRWDGFAINIAAFIHNGTDIAILTIFTDLYTVSIYGVYALVCTGIKQIINSITTGINPTIGEAYAKNNTSELNDKMDIYEYIILVLVFLMFTIGGLLITPFVMIYTNGIKDTNYYQPIFGVLLLISEAVYLIKNPHLNLAYSANKFKDIKIPAFIEALLNIFLSIILVSKFGLNGVAIGTLVAMTYRMVFQINYTSKLIKDRKQTAFYKKIFIFVITTILGLVVCNFIPKTQYNIMSWLIHGIIYLIIFLSLYFIISLMFFKNELKYFKKYLFRK